MFYSKALSKNGPLGTVWIAATCSDAKLSRDQVERTDVVASVDKIVSDVKSPHGFSLRIQAQLLFGIVRIYSKKLEFLFHDYNQFSLSIFQPSKHAEPSVPSRRSTPRVLKQVNKAVRGGSLVIGQQNTSKVNKTVHNVRITEVSCQISSEGLSARVEAEETVGTSVIIQGARVPDGLPPFTRPRRFELDSFDLGISEDTDDNGDDHHQSARQDILLEDKSHHASDFYEPYPGASCSYPIDSACFMPEYIPLPDNMLEFIEGGQPERENENADSAWFTPLKDVLPPEVMDTVAEAKNHGNESKTGDNSGREVNMDENNGGSDCTMISIPLQGNQEGQNSDNVLENMTYGSLSENYTTTEASENDSLLGKLNDDPLAAGFLEVDNDTGEESPESPVINCKTRADNELSPSYLEPLPEDIQGPSSSSRFEVRTPAKTEKIQATKKRRAPLYNKEDYIPTERENKRSVRRKFTWSLCDDEGIELTDVMLRRAMDDPSDLVQKRRKARHSHLDIWRMAKLGSLPYTFMDPLVPYETSSPLARVTAPVAPEISCEESVKARRRLFYKHTESIDACEDTETTAQESSLDASTSNRKLEEPIYFEVPVDCQTESGLVHDEVCACKEDTIKGKSTRVKGDGLSSKLPLWKGLHELENRVPLHNEALNADVDSTYEDVLVDKEETRDGGLRNSTRTRKIASHLHQLFLDQNRKEGTTTLSLNQVLEGTKRKTSVTFFYETLVLKSRGLLEVNQDQPYDDILLSATPRLEEELQRCGK